ncbi:Gag-Pol polyprotein [Artemisia annua]|uniref:Gag-Pol polyprotein n=1 Tax=Artemisia annua TaxID=35608 RepID=A0A2U1M509_ARTAN|nr:Gag-Pol polyprotein [Artemisia annua]
MVKFRHCSYDQLIINLTSNVLPDYLVFDDVAAAILEEENRHNNRKDRQASSRQVEALVMTRGRLMEPGSSGSHNHDDGNALCCEAAVANEGKKRFAYVWLFDMGATFHMITRREWFHQYKPISGGISVYSCNDHKLKIIGIGSIMVKDNWMILVEIQNKILKVIKGALVLMKGEKVAAYLYQLKGEIMEEAEASVASHSPSHRVAITWHQKLGHMSKQGMKIPVEKKLIPGLTKVSLPFCEHCVISKQHRLKFKTSNSRSVYVLELVHFDVWQAPVLSLGGAKYFVSFIDDYSRRCWVYPIKKKSDVFEVFKVCKARVELDSGKKIKCLRTDNGGEYTSDEFDTFCRQEGIKRQFTAAYTPQQNKVVERINRTLLERARAMLATASLEKSFWAEALNTAFELKTPMEMWTGKPVNYSDLHIFGSPVYVIYNSQETTKLDPKSRKCLFLGYADGVKGYRLWDPTAYKVVVSRDAVFMEDKVQENEEGDSTTSETTSVQVEKQSQSSDSSEAVPQHEVNETTESQAPTTRRKPIGNKWVYKIKRNGDDQVERYHARLVVKGYAQKEGVDFNDIFSPVVRMTTVRVVLATCDTYDLHLEQFDLKTAFRHGNLEEEIHMLQPEGFKQKGKENLVCRRRGVGTRDLILSSSRKCLFLGYADGVKGYRLWDPTAYKVVVSRDVVFMEDKVQENEEGDSTTSETTSIQVEKQSQSSDSFEAVPQHEVNETTESQAPTTRRKPIGNKWVYKIKRNGDDQVERYHARLVVKGYAQKEGVDFNDIFSPVVRMTTVRVVLAMCDTYDLHLEQLDVKIAFCHGNLEEEIHMLQLEGFKQKGKENLVCRLNKSLYGLKQAPRCWYKRFDSFIKSEPILSDVRLGTRIMFSKPHNDFVILLLYVDDMLVAGPNKDRISKLKAQLAREFEMKDLRPANKILGMQIYRDRVNYKPISTPFPTNVKLSSKMSPSSEEERMEKSRVPYASAVGSLMFAMICTRPDIANAVGVVSRYMAEPGREHWEAVKRILRYIKGTSYDALCFGESDLTVKGYVDSDYAGDLDGSKSTTGYVFTLSGGTVSWVSKLQSVVAMSTTEAEYVAAAQANKEAVCLYGVDPHAAWQKRKQHESARRDNVVKIDWASIESSSGRLLQIARYIVSYSKWDYKLVCNLVVVSWMMSNDKNLAYKRQ